MHQIARVQFKGTRRDHYAYRGDVPLRVNEFVVVEADRGQDLGWVDRTADAAEHTCDGGCDHHSGPRPVIPPAKRVLRRAAPADIERRLQLSGTEDEVRRRTKELVQKHRLKMKVTEAEWQWDRNKLTVFFTAEKRVDFRALVRDMASVFKTRIELRQIGVRDEAKLVGGLGRCGRELCCRLWLPSIEPVSLQLAKDQGLSLNPAQISGACGRLMSCLRYEHQHYVQAKKRFPKIGTRIRAGAGEEKVVAWDIFQDTVTLRSAEGGTRVVPLAELERAGGKGARGDGARTHGGGGDGQESGTPSSASDARADGSGAATARKRDASGRTGRPEPAANGAPARRPSGNGRRRSGRRPRRDGDRDGGRNGGRDGGRTTG